jgi:uncharacterized OsmC-like protein
MTTETIERTIQTWTREPIRAAAKPTVKARSVCSQAVIESGSFSWNADLPPSLGGENSAPTPTALLLSALAGCAVTFMRDTLAPQFGVRIYSVDATVSCESDSRGLLGMDSVSPDLRNVSLDLCIESPDGDEAVDRVLHAWKERCPIYLALLKPVEVCVSSTVVNWYEASESKEG